METAEIQQAALQSYQNGKYDTAKDLFRILVGIFPEELAYWMSLGSSLEKLGLYEEALKHFQLVALLDEKDPYPHLFAARCLLSLNQKEKGLQALNAVESLSKGHASEKDLLNDIFILRQGAITCPT